MSPLKPPPLDHLRHSAAHLLAAAVLKLYPDAKPATGPPIENGFYYDFDFGDTKISTEDLPKIEAKMKQLLPTWKKFTHQKVPLSKAKTVFKDNPYKLELIKEFVSRNLPLTTYACGDFIDLCRGGHLTSPSNQLRHFKLLSTAGAYWKGNEKNPMLTRIYGTAFPTSKALDQYLQQLKEAQKRDHRKLGKKLDFFSINEDVGKGLILWHPKLAIIRHEVEKLWKERHLQAGYQFVYTPHVGSMKLFTKTRHYSHYIDAMFPVMLHQFIEGESSEDYHQEEQLKPMNCPFHCAIFNNRPRSYRELPLRLAELGTVYRYERSGQLHGMTRVRGFTQDDSHIFCRKSQAVSEVIGVIKLTKEFYDLFGFNEFKAYLSTMPKKHLGLPRDWQFAEKTLTQAIKNCNLPFEIDEGEGAFYGPKIDFKVKDSMNRKWQLATIQWDFNLPSRANSTEKEIRAFQKLKAFRYIFGNEHPGQDYSSEHKSQTDQKIAKFIKEQGRGLGCVFTNEQGKQEEVIMIHRVILGALERFFGVLIEHYAGAFPTWLAPIQVKVLPITDRQLHYARKIHQKLCDANIKSELDARSETLSAKIRNARLEKIPYMLVIGKKEQESGNLTVRTRNNHQLHFSPDSFIQKITHQIATKSLSLLSP